jgi:hypothetical protein
MEDQTMSHEFNRTEANDVPPTRNDILPNFRVTLHAMERYSQRISKKPIAQRALLSNPKLSRRLANGVARILKNATHWGRSRDALVFVARTRAVIVRDGHVVTVIRAAGPLGFTRQKQREWKLTTLGSQAPHAIALELEMCAA